MCALTTTRRPTASTTATRRAASLGAGKSGTFFVDLGVPDSKATMGMNGGPPAPGRAGMTAMSGSGAVDPGHIVAFQVFLHQPAAPRTLRLSHLRLLPSRTGGRPVQGHRGPLTASSPAPTGPASCIPKPSSPRAATPRPKRWPPRPPCRAATPTAAGRTAPPCPTPATSRRPSATGAGGW